MKCEDGNTEGGNNGCCTRYLILAVKIIKGTKNVAECFCLCMGKSDYLKWFI